MGIWTYFKGKLPNNLICALHLHSLESRRPWRVSCFSESCVRTTSLLLCRRLVLFVLLEVLRCELSIDDEYINFKNYSTYLKFWFSIDLWLMGIYAYKKSYVSIITFEFCMHSFMMQYALFVCLCTFIYACIFVWEEFFKILSLYHSKGGV